MGRGRGRSAAAHIKKLDLEPATFRPRIARLGPQLLAGGAAGGIVGVVAHIPLLLAFLFGAIASALAVSMRHAGALRVVADERGVRVLGGEAPVDAAWGAVKLGFGLAQRADGQVRRYAVFADGLGRSFPFADQGAGLSGHPVQGADGKPAPVVELRDAPLLLGLLIQRAPAWNVLPEPLREAPAPSLDVDVTVAEPAAGTQAGKAAARGKPGERRVGIWGVAVKLGAGALKAAKTAKLGWLAASAAAYSFLFSWKFAVTLLVQLIVHEYGHVHAMRRTGMKVRGMYFLPLVGAVAVSEDDFTTRRQQVYVAMNGPIWGSLLTVLPLGLWRFTGHAEWATVASWWALLNLFNLLPISPLDGGRIMQAFASSFSSGVGVAASVLGLSGAVALASTTGFSLLWLVAMFGAMELAGEMQARTGSRALRLLPEPARFRPPHWLFMRAAVGGVGAGGPADAMFLRTLARQEKTARAEPLRPLELLAWGLAYAGLAAGLVLLVWALRHVPGADAASKVLE